LETCKIETLHLRLLMVKSRLVMKQLNSHRFTRFVYALFNASFSNFV
jgi:hypothetical protein